MTGINLHNYEAYLLDFSEGNLALDTIQELKEFVQLHPELEINLSDLSFPELTKTFENVDFKDELNGGDCIWVYIH